MKAFGVHAVQTSGPASQEIYKSFRPARKFDGLLEAAWREGDDTIYRVPGESLAYVLRADELVRHAPVNGLDLQEVRRYVAALQHPARFAWHGTSNATVEAQIEPGQTVSVQESYSPGWRANNARVFSDALGMIALEPHCSGICRIALTYDGGLEMKLARLASGLVLTGFLIWIPIYPGRKSRKAG